MTTMQPTVIKLGNFNQVEKHEPGSVGVEVEWEELRDGEGKLVGNRARPVNLEEDLRRVAERRAPDDGSVAWDARENLLVITRPDLGRQVHNVSLPVVDWLPNPEYNPATSPDSPQHVWRPLKPSEVVTLVKRAWPFHSDANGPEWVECEDEKIARAISDEFTYGFHQCPVGRPADWQATPLGTAVAPADIGWREAQEDAIKRWEQILRALRDSGGPQALMVNGGRDAAFRLLYDTSRTSLAGPFNYVALTVTQTITITPS
jgi:hypothetical protein